MSQGFPDEVIEHIVAIGLDVRGLGLCLMVSQMLRTRTMGALSTVIKIVLADRDVIRLREWHLLESEIARQAVARTLSKASLSQLLGTVMRGSPEWDQAIATILDQLIPFATVFTGFLKSGWGAAWFGLHWPSGMHRESQQVTGAGGNRMRVKPKQLGKIDVLYLVALGESIGYDQYEWLMFITALQDDFLRSPVVPPHETGTARFVGSQVFVRDVPSMHLAVCEESEFVRMLRRNHAPIAQQILEHLMEKYYEYMNSFGNYSLETVLWDVDRDAELTAHQKLSLMLKPLGDQSPLAAVVEALVWQINCYAACWLEPVSA